jgi:hypothetical protein
MVSDQRRQRNIQKRAEGKRARRSAVRWEDPPISFSRHVRAADDIIVRRREDVTAGLENKTGHKHPSAWQLVASSVKDDLKRLDTPELVIAYLTGRGLTYVNWDGRCVLQPRPGKRKRKRKHPADVNAASTPTRLIDAADGRIVGALGGRPLHDPTWDSAFHDAGELLKDLRPQLGSHPDEDRGLFYQLRAGPSYGGGQSVSRRSAFLHIRTSGADHASASFLRRSRSKRLTQQTRQRWSSSSQSRSAFDG